MVPERVLVSFQYAGCPANPKSLEKSEKTKQRARRFTAADGAGRENGVLRGPQSVDKVLILLSGSKFTAAVQLHPRNRLLGDMIGGDAMQVFCRVRPSATEDKPESYDQKVPVRLLSLCAFRAEDRESSTQECSMCYTVSLQLLYSRCAITPSVGTRFNIRTNRLHVHLVTAGERHDFTWFVHRGLDFNGKNIVCSGHAPRISIVGNLRPGQHSGRGNTFQEHCQKRI